MKFENNENKLENTVLVLGLVLKHNFICESAILSSKQVIVLIDLCEFLSDQK